jgi:hypothetical protein
MTVEAESTGDRSGDRSAGVRTCGRASDGRSRLAGVETLGASRRGSERATGARSADRRDEELDELLARDWLRDEELGEEEPRDEELVLADDFDPDDDFVLLAGRDFSFGGSALASCAGSARRAPSRATDNQPARRPGDL